MKITYYRTHYNGFTIFADSVDTADKIHYVSHTDDTVTVSLLVDGWDDGSDRREEHTFYRRFEDEKRDRLDKLNKHLSDMRLIVSDLSESTHAINENVVKVPLVEYLTKNQL